MPNARVFGSSRPRPQRARSRLDATPSDVAPSDAIDGHAAADTVFVGDVNAKEKTYPRAQFVGLAALARQKSAKDEAEPLYLRASQAERMKTKSTEEA